MRIYWRGKVLSDWSPRGNAKKALVEWRIEEFSGYLSSSATVSSGLNVIAALHFINSEGISVLPIQSPLEFVNRFTI